jgi:hypothetical protein
VSCRVVGELDKHGSKGRIAVLVGDESLQERCRYEHFIVSSKQECRPGHTSKASTHVSPSPTLPYSSLPPPHNSMEHDKTKNHVIMNELRINQIEPNVGRSPVVDGPEFNEND